MPDQLGKRLVFALLIAILAIMNMGALLTTGMMMENGILHPCPHMDSPSLCAMDPIEHITQWQQTFTATLPIAIMMPLLMLACIALLPILGTPVILRNVDASLVRQRERRQAWARGPLAPALASGIIHPKTF